MNRHRRKELGEETVAGSELCRPERFGLGDYTGS